MKNSKKLLLASLIVLSNTAFSQEIYNKDGLEVGVGGFLNLGVKSANYDLDQTGTGEYGQPDLKDYKNSKIGIDEDAALFNVNFKKKVNNFEFGGFMRYGASYENNLERNGGALYAKYNFNEKLSLQYQKFDYGYTKLTFTGAGVLVTGKENGTGYQLDLSAPGQWRSLVLDNDVSQFGNAFLGQGITGVQWSGGEFTPNGKVWNSFMAYATNYVNYAIKPNALNLEYNNGKLGIISSAVYNNQEVSDSTGGATATNKGIIAKASYKINDKTLVGGGVSYGDGKTDYTSSTDTGTEIIAQNAFYQTNIKGVDLYTEVAHSKYELTGKNAYKESDSEKELVGAYGKISKFTKFGIPAIELKVAQSTFDKVNGTEYSDAQTNTLVELVPSFTVFIKKIPGAMASVNATLGKYQSENINGTSGNDASGTQVKVGTYLTYFF